MDIDLIIMNYYTNDSKFFALFFYSSGKMEAEEWGGDGGMTTDWANEPAPGLGAPGPMAPAAGGVKYQVSDDWANQVPAASDWAAEATAPAPDAAAAAPSTGQWGGSSNWN